MILGLSTSAFTALHVAISLIAIASGIVVLFGFLKGRPYPGWTALFLITTVLTSTTGFFFKLPFGPAHVVGILSLVLLAAAILGLYVFKLDRHWRWIYVTTAIVSLYLNVMVGIIQAFKQLAFLQPLAPTQSELPFLIAQIAVLGAFVVLGFLAVRAYRPMLGTAMR